MTSIVQRSFHLDGPLTLGHLIRISAEARDAGVPSDAKVNIIEALEGSLNAALRQMVGQAPGTEVIFTWPS